MAETSRPDEPVNDWRAVKVGVFLTRAPEDLDEWLVDAGAFDAAGADALWFDSGPDAELDVLALTAALSVVTFRSLLMVTMAGDLLGQPRTLATIARLSRGRLALIADHDHQQLATLAPDMRVFRRLPGSPQVFEGRLREGGLERWVSSSLPQSRADWQTSRAEAAEAGVRGLVLPADARLLDLLRNPDDPGDRRDLLLAQG